MEKYLNALNEELNSVYRSINTVEELMLRDMNEGELSLSEMHMLECIGTLGKEAVTATDIAQKLEITPPSVTAMVKRLEKKGYIEKERSREDARCVHIALTRKGRRAEVAHRYFHKKMLRNMIRDLSEGERDMLLSALVKINGFIHTSLDEYAVSKADNT